MVVLVGPPGAGKSMIADAIASAPALQLSVKAFDMERERWYGKYGYTAARAERIYDEGGALALHRYETQFEARAIEAAVTYPGAGVIDCGGGVLLQYTESNTARVQRSLAASVSIMALPCPRNLALSVSVLLERVRARAADDSEVNRWLARGGVELLHRLTEAAFQYAAHVGMVVDTGCDGDATGRLVEVLPRWIGQHPQNTSPARGL